MLPAEFDRCLRRPPFHRSGPFALHLQWVDPTCEGSTNAPLWRLGLVIPKRFEPSAVARNTVKRRWRDAFRRSRAAWAAEFGSADLVVRLTAPLIAKPSKKKAVGRKAEPAAVVAPPTPARVRARDRFDAAALLAALAERLRSRGGRPAAVAPSSAIVA